MRASFIYLSLASTCTLSACNHAAIEKDVDQKLSNESSVTSVPALYAETTATIENAKNVSPEQKSKLFALRTSTRDQLTDNTQKTNKLKAVLIDDLVQNNYNENEVEVIKNKLKDLKQKRLSIMFGSIKDANDILGRQAMLNSQIMNDFLKIQHD